MKILRKLKNGWMKFAHTLGRINSTILLSIIYFVFIGIYSVLSFLIFIFTFPFKKKSSTYWVDHNGYDDDKSYKYPFA